MAIQIILLRGINVGGHNKLPMAELTSILSDLGATEVKTYIQSGNAVISGKLQEQHIAYAIKREKSFQPKIMVLSLEAFTNIASANPFPEATTDGKTLHIWFLSSSAVFDSERADALATDTERYLVTDHAIYLHAPDGIGRSKLAAKMEDLAGVPTTARNWNTVAKLLTLAKA